MKYSLIIPIFNEGNTVGSLIEGIKYLKNEVEFIFINDGSSDSSLNILSKYEDIILINSNVNHGKGASILKALNVAKGNYVILFDGDLEINPIQIQKLILLHKENLNTIYKGKRVSKTNRSFFDFGNKILNIMFNKIYSTSFSDIFCCLIIIEKNVLHSFKLNSKRFGIETEIMANIALNSLPCKEIDVDYKRRKVTNGKKLNIFDVFDILQVMFSKKYL